MNPKSKFAACVFVLLALPTLIVEAAADCANVTAADVQLMIKAKDVESVSTALRCKQVLLYDEGVRRAFNQLFQGKTLYQPDFFADNRAFLEALRKAGMDFIRDLRPLSPGDGGANLLTPLGTALKSQNAEGVKWLLASADGKDFKAYPMLVVEMVNITSKYKRTNDAALMALLAAVPRGLPIDARDYAAFRRAYGNWVAAQDVIHYRDMSRFAEKTTMEPADGEWWKTVSQYIAPPDVAQARKIQAEVVDSFTRGKLGNVDTSINSWQHSLDAVQGDEMVPDPNHMLSASGWATADAARTLLDQLRERRIALEDLRLRVGLGKMGDGPAPVTQAVVKETRPKLPNDPRPIETTTVQSQTSGSRSKEKDGQRTDIAQANDEAIARFESATYTWASQVSKTTKGPGRSWRENPNAPAVVLDLSTLRLGAKDIEVWKMLPGALCSLENGDIRCEKGVGCSKEHIALGQAIENHKDILREVKIKELRQVLAECEADLNKTAYAKSVINVYGVEAEKATLKFDSGGLVKIHAYVTDHGEEFHAAATRRHGAPEISTRNNPVYTTTDIGIGFGPSGAPTPTLYITEEYSSRNIYTWRARDYVVSQDGWNVDITRK